MSSHCMRVLRVPAKIIPAFGAILSEDLNYENWIYKTASTVGDVIVAAEFKCQDSRFRQMQNRFL